MSISTLALTTGSVVLTTEPVGADFGIPLVAPTHRPDERGVVERTVRNRCRARGGIVVWFTDGTKTLPTHGRTAWEARPPAT